MRFRIWAWMETSRAETGSSATMSFGVEGEGPGQSDPLALAAGELVGVELEGLGGRPDLVQRLSDTLARGSLRRADALDDERLPEDRADPHARVERGVGVLEHDLQVAAARDAGRCAPQLGDVVALEADRCPSAGVSSATTSRPIVVLPHPDSPTRPKVSPRRHGEARRRRPP